MQRFLVATTPTVGTEVILSAEESHHLATVLRMRVDEKIIVVDGRGFVGHATVTAVSSKGTRIQVTSAIPAGPPPRVSVAFGLPKPPALEFIFRRCAEVGVESLQPLLTDRSQRFSSWNSGRWEKILREVTKQCETPFSPRLSEPQPMSDWFSRRGPDRGLAVCDDMDRTGKGLAELSDSQWDLLIGPEGGWSEPELKDLAGRGARSIGLGQLRLRTETAALVGLVFLKRALGEM